MPRLPSTGTLGLTGTTGAWRALRRRHGRASRNSLIELLERAPRRAKTSLDVLHGRLLGTKADGVLRRVGAMPGSAVRVPGPAAPLRQQIFVEIGEQVPMPREQLLV